ncbi:MAG: serine/threonine-protein kinase, partial [Pirellulaceae bacterium]
MMKALEKDRTRRYETANGFAADVQRYLEDEPVQACPPSTAYRFKKFVRRNKTALATASVVLLSVMAVLVAFSLSCLAARDAAESEHELAERQLRIQRGISEALTEATRLRGQSAGGTGSVSTLVRDHVQRAVALAESGAADPQLVAQVRQLAATHKDGRTCGFLYDPMAATPFVLLSEMDRAVLINNNADIVGYVAADNAVVLDTWNATSRTYATRRWPGNGVPSGLNDLGMIVVTALPTGSAVKRYDPDSDSWDDFSGYPYSMMWGGGINNAGTFVGRRKVDSGRGKSVDAAFRFTEPGTIKDILTQNSALGYDVNLQDDVVLWDGSRSLLYTNEVGLWHLDKLVVGDTVEWVNAYRIDA